MPTAVQAGSDSYLESEKILQCIERPTSDPVAAISGCRGGGDAEQLVSLLVEDAMLVVDAGPKGGRFGRVRNLPGLILGAKKVAAFLAATTSQGVLSLRQVMHEINGEPVLLLLREEKLYAATFLSISDGGNIRGIFIQADTDKLSHLGSL